MRCAPHDAGSEADCTRACVGKGSKYALVVGDKVYTLDTADKAALGNLDKLAGASAKVTGTLSGDAMRWPPSPPASKSFRPAALPQNSRRSAGAALAGSRIFLGSIPQFSSNVHKSLC